MKPVELDMEAAEEIREAIEFLESRRPRNGELFEREVEAALDLIGKQPKAFSPHRGRFRKFRIDRFDYLIFYAELDAYVWVAAVSHPKREPDYWQHRRPTHGNID